MIVTYRYRILPTKQQHRALEQILEDQRQLYNAALEERIDAYRKQTLTLTWIDQNKSLTQWRRDDAEARCLPVSLQRWTLKRVDDAQRGFFRRITAGLVPGFPRFRGRGRFKTFGFQEFSGIHFDGSKVWFKGLPSRLRVHVHRPFPMGQSIKSCVFHRDVQGWTIGLVIDAEAATRRHGSGAVGVDLGISRFVALSDGGFVPSLRASRKNERRIRKAQRALARKAHGSSGRRKARRCLGRLYAATTRARTNHLHQASARIAYGYEKIVIEKLKIDGLARSALAKDVRDAAWGRFISMLRYKAEWAGSLLIEVDPRNTSQDCSDCGRTVPKKLDDRTHRCSHCGLVLDRDLNAARNVLNRAGVGPGLPNVAGSGMRAGGILGRDEGNGLPSLRSNRDTAL